MSYDKPNRKTIRLQGYNYSSSGIYFITICAQKRRCVFGEIIDGEMKLNGFGTIVKQQWLLIPKRFNIVRLDEFIVMPNHFHGIIQIDWATANGITPTRATARVAPTGDIRDNYVGAPLAGARNDKPGAQNNNVTVGQIIGIYKSLCVNQCLQYIKQNNKNVILGKLWQRNYYERILRNQNELQNVQKYIRNNHIEWLYDKNNPENFRY